MVFLLTLWTLSLVFPSWYCATLTQGWVFEMGPGWSLRNALTTNCFSVTLLKQEGLSSSLESHSSQSQMSILLSGSDANSRLGLHLQLPSTSHRARLWGMLVYGYVARSSPMGSCMLPAQELALRPILSLHWSEIRTNSNAQQPTLSTRKFCSIPWNQFSDDQG